MFRGSEVLARGREFLWSCGVSAASNHILDVLACSVYRFCEPVPYDTSRPYTVRSVSVLRSDAKDCYFVSSFLFLAATVGGVKGGDWKV